MPSGTPWQERFPFHLPEIHNPLPLSTLRGDLSALHASWLAIVGAQCQCQWAIAGEGVMAEGGRTAAVIASGVDIAYPSENADLMPSIAETDAVISERPPNRAPMARHFPRRNRLISGLSSGVVVVEAAPKSKSLITACMAAEQGREVMAVPGSPLDARHRGTNQLIRKVATLVETVEDIVASLDNLALARFPRTPSRPFMADDPANLPDRPAEKRDVISSTGDDISLSVRSLEPTSDPTPPGGGTLIKRICERLGTEPLLVDELIRQCHANSSERQHSLLELELEGRIERHPSNRVSLATS